MKKSTALFLLALQLLFSFSLSGCKATEKPAPAAYSPEICWSTSAPEAQGMDSSVLLSMFETIVKEKVPIHSVLLIRNGCMVCEAYFHPFHRTMPHDLFSATKSFTSTLIGIAISEGKIKGTDQKITDIFPDLKIPKNELGIEDMTLENILTMSAGHKTDSVDSVYGNRNWVKTFFSLPFSKKPGTGFLYDSGASHLLSAVLQKTTGQTEESYAAEHLFSPMVIGGYTWEKTAEGLSTGGWGLRMTPVDMAKFGCLLLNKGVWEGEQLVPASWIETATQKHIDGCWGETPADSYGYQFWINPFGGFRADGFAGQFIYVLPEHDLVAVFTSGINYQETYQPAKLMNGFVIPAIKSNEPLPENRDGCKALEAFIRELQNPEPVLAKLPETAVRINQKKFTMNGSISSFSFTFDKEDECVLHIVQQGRKLDLPVGIDGLYRSSDIKQIGSLVWYPAYPGVALKGRWESDSVFVVDWQYLEEPYHEEYRFTFEIDSAALEITEYVVGSAGPMQPYVKYQAKMAP